MRDTGPHLGDSKAEGGGVCVGPFPVLQHQASVFRQRQVVTRGQVPESERLTPADVAPAPAVKVATIIAKEPTQADIKQSKGCPSQPLEAVQLISRSKYRCQLLIIKQAVPGSYQI